MYIFFIKKIIVILIFYSSLINNRNLEEFTIGICGYLLFKWLSNYRKCTFSYIECKIRKVKKEKGYLYNFLENIFNINKYENKYLIYCITLCFFIINLIKFINPHLELGYLFLD
tara:strand:- start:6220 stop:6561 length:342 start_codon:yes stop_codon:yes gene_type:complete